MKIRHHAKIEGGKLDIIDKDYFQKDIADRNDGSYYVVIEQPLKSRSSRANAYYWGIVLKIISDETGHTPDELHEIFKQNFVPHKSIDWKGEKLQVRPSTKLLNTKQFSSYIEFITIEAGELGITIPSADEYMNV